MVEVQNEKKRGIIKNMVNLEYTASTYDKALVVIEQALHELRRLIEKQEREKQDYRFEVGV